MLVEMQRKKQHPQSCSLKTFQEKQKSIEILRIIPRELDDKKIFLQFCSNDLTLKLIIDGNILEIKERAGYKIPSIKGR
jgi:hypothetical protein